MRIAICVKQVPATSDIQIDAVTKQMKRANTLSELNLCDGYALELALRLKETYGARISAFTMGPPQAKSVLKQCCSLGVDEAYLLSDAAFAGSDTYATAYILSRAIRRAEAQGGAFDLILCGKQSSDGDTAQVGAELAEQCGIPQITGICGLPVIEGQTVSAVQDHETELVRIKASLPALLTVGKTPYELRYATISGVIASNHTDAIKTLSLADLPEIDTRVIGLDGSPTRTIDTFAPPKRSAVTLINGETAYEKAAELKKQLSQLGLV